MKLATILIVYLPSLALSFYGMYIGYIDESSIRVILWSVVFIINTMFILTAGIMNRLSNIEKLLKNEKEG